MLVDLVVTEFQIPQDLPEDGTYYSVGVGLDVASRACGTSILICESYYTPSCLMVNSAEWEDVFPWKGLQGASEE